MHSHTLFLSLYREKNARTLHTGVRILLSPTAGRSEVRVGTPGGGNNGFSALLSGMSWHSLCSFGWGLNDWWSCVLQHARRHAPHPLRSWPQSSRCSSVYCWNHLGLWAVKSLTTKRQQMHFKPSALARVSTLRRWRQHNFQFIAQNRLNCSLDFLTCWRLEPTVNSPPAPKGINGFTEAQFD